MEISITNLKRHIVTELLIISYAQLRNVPIPEGSRNFGIYYRHRIEAEFQIETIINQDEEMATFYSKWEQYDTYLQPAETSLPVITLAMKLVLVKALKYADDPTLNNIVKTISAQLKLY